VRGYFGAGSGADDALIKSQDAALPCVLSLSPQGGICERRTTSTPHSFGLARLAFELFMSAF
jgi:hypothetical protein